MDKSLFPKLLLALLVLPVAAQNLPELDRFQEKLNRHLEKQFPEWRHKSVAQIEGSKNVLTERWVFSNRVVNISIVPHKSAEEARAAIQAFVKFDPEREVLSGLGDEAYAWGYSLSEVVLRKGKMNVYIRTYADVESDADAPALNSRQKGERAKSEMKRLSREFAKQAADGLDLP